MARSVSAVSCRLRLLSNALRTDLLAAIPSETSGLIGGPVFEAAAKPYQSTRLSRYNAISRSQEQS